MLEAHQLGALAATIGFDWESALDALEKVSEEVEELREQLSLSQPSPQDIMGEVGDLLFAACMVARKAQVDPMQALSATNAKFRARFAFIEAQLERQGISAQDATLAQLEAIWQQAKAAP